MSCGRDGTTEIIDGKDERAVQYFPNMYRPVSYETYVEADVFPGDMEAQQPVEGSVPRGWMPYDYEDTNEGYENAKNNLNNPIPLTKENLEQGQVSYGLFCAICHGDKGDGQGHLVKTEKILGVPAYNDRDLTDGSIYHVLYYGINNMGSYASQTTEKERWQIIHYVNQLTAELNGEEPATPVDESLPTMTPAVNKTDASEETPEPIIAEGDDVEQTDAQILNSANDTLQTNNNNSDSGN
jgi:mono/diheme cytochrome c family protein